MKSVREPCYYQANLLASGSVEEIVCSLPHWIMVWYVIGLTEMPDIEETLHDYLNSPMPEDK
jgi:hypothetical protein